MVAESTRNGYISGKFRQEGEKKTRIIKMAILRASKQLLDESPETIALLRGYFESVVERPSEKPYERVFAVKGVDVPDGDAEIVVIFARENEVIRISHWVEIEAYYLDKLRNILCE